MIDWRAFLEAHGIDYVTDGRNVAQGNVNIPCPFCGVDDPSAHMGLSLVSGAWGCWRDQEHRGRRPEKLIVKLLGCTWGHAHSLVEEVWVDDGTDEAPRNAMAGPVRFDDAFRPLRAGDPFAAYLERRGFGEPLAVAESYRLLGALHGAFSKRLVFPFFVRRRLLGWTGRTIGTRDRIRYKTFPPSNGLHVLYNFDSAFEAGGNVLFVCEGPLDALKVDWYGRDFGVRAIALLGVALSDAKASALSQLSTRFQHVRFLLDADAFAVALKLQGRTSFLHTGIQQLPTGCKDPGDLSPAAVRRLAKTALA